jgi:hypothetical protein
MMMATRIKSRSDRMVGDTDVVSACDVVAAAAAGDNG